LNALVLAAPQLARQSKSILNWFSLPD